jgi:hypothetical protein
VIGADQTEDEQDQPVEDEQAADQAADVEPVGGARHLYLVEPTGEPTSPWEVGRRELRCPTPARTTTF